MSDIEVKWDQTRAQEEGWYLTNVSFRPVIEAYYAFEQKFSKPNPFECGGGLADWDVKAREYVQRKAREYVQRKAAEGSAYHIEALARTQLL